MIDFENARRKAFQEIAETESIEVIAPADLKKYNLQRFAEGWLIPLIVFDNSGEARPILFLMGIPAEFPLVLPKIYLAPEDHLAIGTIPHVDVKGFVCIFDEESIDIDAAQPGRVAKVCLQKARSEVEAGINGLNHGDFSDEFVAYWMEEYEANDKLTYGLTMLSRLPANGPAFIKAVSTSRAFNIYSIILHDEGEDFKNLRDYLNKQGYHTIDIEVLYLGQAEGLKPPFTLTNSKLMEFVEEHFPNAEPQFRTFVNKQQRNRVLTFSIPSVSQSLLFGLRLKPIETARKGFRTGAITPFASISTFQAKTQVERIKLDNYTRTRIFARTDGVQQSHGYSFAIAGLGSIGSNLLPYLIALGINRLHLIDPEILVLENTNRHLLGVEDIGNFKVAAIERMLSRKNPLIKFSTSTRSIIREANKRSSLLDEFDYLFVAIGKTPIENYIIEALREGKLAKPTFFIWVEPYLMGGHCLLIQPNHSIDLDALYDEHLFRYNVIDGSEYRNNTKQLQLREAGCQGSYMPFGQKSITLFLSALMPNIYDIIETNEQKSLALTWLNRAASGGDLLLSEYGKKLVAGSVNIIYL